MSYEKIIRGDWMLVKKSETAYAVIGYNNGQCKNNGYFANGQSDEAVNYVAGRWVSKKTAVGQFNRLVGAPGKLRF